MIPNPNESEWRLTVIWPCDRPFDTTRCYLQIHEPSGEVLQLQASVHPTAVVTEAAQAALDNYFGEFPDKHKS